MSLVTCQLSVVSSAESISAILQCAFNQLSLLCGSCHPSLCQRILLSNRIRKFGRLGADDEYAIGRKS